MYELMRKVSLLQWEASEHAWSGNAEQRTPAQQRHVLRVRVPHLRMQVDAAVVPLAVVEAVFQEVEISDRWVAVAPRDVVLLGERHATPTVAL